MSAPGSLREEVAFHAYRTVARASRALPERVGGAAFDRLGRAAYALMPALRNTVAANQAQVLGLSADDPVVLTSTREAFRLYARYWAQTFRFPLLSDEETLARTAVTGYEHVEEAFEGGRGVICVLPHLGNWDVGGRYMAARGHAVVSVAEELRPQRLFDLFRSHRESLGMEILALSGDGQVGRRLARRLNENRMVALVADRDLGGRGMQVEMFGRPRRLPTGPAFLSLTTGAPILVTPTYQTAGGWRIVFGAPLSLEETGERRRDVATLTRLMAAEFERAISAAPADWHLFQPGWDEA